ncbi:MAG: beta-lactamase family protein [Chloroflexi bacterium]|nr:beta-lactamase family protein [Chloroflexota bacterium]
MNQQLNDQVTALLDELTGSGAEVGLQAAAYLNGEQIVDAWSGIADEQTGAPVTGDTMFTSWSTTKGFTATCAHILIDRGDLDLDAPMTRYWPEFGAHGKDKVTVRDALTHRTGVPNLPAGTTLANLVDWDHMANALASEPPQINPHEETAYHAFTFGWVVGELVGRASGMPIAEFAQSELCGPLGITDFYLGIPDAELMRVGRLRHAPSDSPAIFETNPNDVFIVPSGMDLDDAINSLLFRRGSVPGAGGIMSARAISRHYAMFIGGGELDGVRVMSEEAARRAGTFEHQEHDLKIGAAPRRALGYFMGGTLESGGHVASGGENAFGHGGYGGSLGFADPDFGLSFGLTKNLLITGETDPLRSTAYRVAQLIRDGIS